MTLKVVDDKVQEDVHETRTYTREEAERECRKCEATLPRWERQVENAQAGLEECKAKIKEWQAVIAQLPEPPEPPKEDDPANNPALVNQG